MQFNDYKINSQLRSVFVSRWVDLSRLEYGVTNGVVYLHGDLRHHLTRAQQDNPERARSEEVELVTLLERLIRSVHGVRDVVFRLNNMVKVGSRWKHK